MNMQPSMNTREDGVVRFLGLPTAVRATSETTGGGFGLVEHWTVPPGFASPYHTHHQEDEAFYVLEGEVAFVLDGKWTSAGPGTYLFGPRGIPHGFQVEGTAPAHMMLLCSPGGFEKFVLELSEPMTDTPPGPPDMAKLIEVAAKYKIDVHGPLPERTPSVNEFRSDHDAIEDVRNTHVAALNAGDAARWAGVFTADAVQMPPNFPANKGQANIRNWAQGFLSAFQVKFSLEVADVHVAGDSAIESGAYTIAMTPRSGGPTMDDTGKYITVYQRTAGRGWALARDIWNSDRPLPGGMGA
jgi:uncharacterized protein (TIGR02246 family)